MTNTTTSGAAIQRYKICNHADEWGQRSSTPSGIPDASGSWVRYADHVTALAAGQAAAAQAVVQDDLITLRKPTTSAELLWLLKLAHLVISDVDKTLEETFSPAQPAAEPSRFGSIYNAKTEAARKAVIEALSGVQALSAAPAGFVPIAAFDRLHAHAESLAARLLAASPTPPAEQAATKAAPVSDDVVRDAARYQWLRRWKGQEHEPPFTVQHEIDGTLWGGDLDAAIDAAIAAQGGK